MGKKIFVSYKYNDSSVYSPYGYKTVRDYVNEIEKKLDYTDNIYKGEHDGEDLSNFKDSTIESHLRDKIFDSTVTIVLISKNMKDKGVQEDEQWIPWEISYSLKNPCRNGRTSSTNGIICVVLPDENNSYDYYINKIGIRQNYNESVGFEIISKNRYNRLDNKEPVSYIYTCEWDYFINHINSCVDEAVDRQGQRLYYKIVKDV